MLTRTETLDDRRAALRLVRCDRCGFYFWRAADQAMCFACQKRDDHARVEPRSSASTMGIYRVRQDG